MLKPSEMLRERLNYGYLDGDLSVLVTEVLAELDGHCLRRGKNLEMLETALEQRDEARAQITEMFKEHRRLANRQEESEERLADLRKQLDLYDIESFTAAVDREVLEALEDAAERNGKYVIDPELLRQVRRVAEEHLRSRRTEG